MDRDNLRITRHRGHEIEVRGDALRCRVCDWSWERGGIGRVARCPGVKRYRAGCEPGHLLTQGGVRRRGWAVPRPVACRNPTGYDDMSAPVYLYDPAEARALTRSQRLMWGEIVAALCRACPIDTRDGSPITPERIASRERTQDTALLRQMAFLLMREHMGESASCTLIGSWAGRDHTTVLFGIEAAGRKIAADPGARRVYEGVKAELGIGRGDSPRRDGRVPSVRPPERHQPRREDAHPIARTPLQEYERRAAKRRAEQQLLRYA